MSLASFFLVGSDELGLSNHVALHRHFQLRFRLHENVFIVAAKINDIYQAVSGEARI